MDKGTNNPKQCPGGLTRSQIPHNARVPDQRRVPGPPGRLPRLPARSPAQRRRRIRLPGRRHRQPMAGHHRREPGTLLHTRWPGQPGSRNHLPVLHQRTTRNQPGRDSGQPDEADEAGELAAWAAGLGFGRYDLDDLVRDAYSRQASKTNKDGLEAQVRFLVESRGAGRARSLLSDLLPQTERTRLRRRAEQRAPSAPRGWRLPPCLLPGRIAPASTAGGPACFHPGGRVKPTTGDSPPFDAGSP